MSREGSSWISGRGRREKRRAGCGFVRIGCNFYPAGVGPEAERGLEKEVPRRQTMGVEAARVPHLPGTFPRTMCLSKKPQPEEKNKP